MKMSLYEMGPALINGFRVGRCGPSCLYIHSLSDGGRNIVNIITVLAVALYATLYNANSLFVGRVIFCSTQRGFAN